MTTTAPTFHRIASGDYETRDGRFRCYREPDISPPAWTVEDIEREQTVIDGAATKRDAIAIFTDWYVGAVA